MLILLKGINMIQTNDRIELIDKFKGIMNSNKLSNLTDAAKGNKVILSVLADPIDNTDIERQGHENTMFNPLNTIRSSSFPCIHGVSIQFIEKNPTNPNIESLVPVNTINGYWIHFKNESIRNIPINIKSAYLVKLLKESSYIEIPTEHLGWYTFANPKNAEDDSDTILYFDWAGIVSCYRFDVNHQKDIDLLF